MGLDEVDWGLRDGWVMMGYDGSVLMVDGREGGREGRVREVGFGIECFSVAE